MEMSLLKNFKVCNVIKKLQIFIYINSKVTKGNTYDDITESF